jgi:hypothetical protein
MPAVFACDTVSGNAVAHIKEAINKNKNFRSLRDFGSFLVRHVRSECLCRALRQFDNKRMTLIGLLGSWRVREHSGLTGGQRTPEGFPKPFGF